MEMLAKFFQGLTAMTAIVLFTAFMFRLYEWSVGNGFWPRKKEE